MNQIQKILKINPTKNYRQPLQKHFIVLFNIKKNEKRTIINSNKGTIINHIPQSGYTSPLWDRSELHFHNFGLFFVIIIF